MYNLPEDKHIFLHVTYSMLEEGYDIDEILGLWVLADEEKMGELMESLTLTEEIDLTNQDLQDISRYYFHEGRWGWLNRLFGKKKITPPRRPKVDPDLSTSGGRPITQGRGTNKIDPTRPPSGNVTVNKTRPTNPLVDKVKKNLPQIAGGATALTGGALILPNLLPPEPGDGNAAPREQPKKDEQPTPPPATDPDADAAAKAKAEEEARRRAEEEAARKKAEAESSPKRSYGWWRLQNQQPDLYKRSPGYQTSLRAYRNIRANPIPSIYKDHYEVIADYLIKEGHASDIEEANYVMQQLDEEFIQNIIDKK